jgi:uncharacterized membrane protein
MEAVKMALRKILFVLAIVVILMGLSQIVFARWWVRHLPSYIESRSFYAWGVLPLLFGVILLIGILERVVGCRPFLSIVSLLSIIGGVVVIAQPEFAKDFVSAVFLKRSYSIKLLDLWLGGLVRILIGLTILYGLLRPEPPDRLKQPSIEPDRPVAE